MSKVTITKAKLDVLAARISAKSGASLPLTIEQMIQEVDGLEIAPGCPVFTVTYNDNWTQILSVTCDKTYAECYSFLDNGQECKAVAYVNYTDESGTGNYICGMTGYHGISDTIGEMVSYIGADDCGVPNFQVYISSLDAITYTTQPETLQELSVSQNGTYEPVYSVYNAVHVNVPTGTARTSSDLTVSGATVTAPAGLYSANASASVASGSAATPATSITANPSISVNSSTGVISASVSASQNVTPTVSAGYVSSGTAGTVSVSGSNTEQLSTQAGKTVTPTESEQTAVAAGKYTTGAVKVGAISSTYVGSGITQRDSTDLTASGATVTVPAGYYDEAASKSVASGSATTPATTVTVTPGISVSSGGLITATASGTKSVTPTVSAGYVSTGTAGTITVSGSNTSQLTTLGATTYNTSSTDQTITSGKYITGTQTIKAVTTSGISAGNIKAGVTVKVGDANDDDRIAGVTGTFTADADATAEDIALGKTAYVNGVKITGTATGGGYVTQDANGYIILPSEGGGGGGGGATQHTIHLEFSDSTDTDVDVYYDDSLIGTIITAYNPSTWTYSSKTVTLAQLDNVTWYDKQSIPTGVQLVDYTTIKSGYVIDDATGEEMFSEWSCCSDFILVDPTMTFSYVAYRWYNIVFYDSTKAYLGKLYLDNDYDTLTGDYANGTLTSAKFPSGTAYVRLSTYPGNNVSASTMSLIRTA